MKADFDKIRSSLKTGLWQITRDLVTDERTLELDDVARGAFRVDEGMSPPEVYDYWTANLDPDSRTAFEEFFGSVSFEDEMLESVYIWKLPGEKEQYIRITGELKMKKDETAVYTGICADITNMKNMNSLLERDGVQKMIYDLAQESEAAMEALGTIVEFRNMESTSHIHCVKEFTRIMADYVASHYPEYGITHRVALAVAAASPLHDVGKIGISEMILLKPGRLTRSEYDMMKTHSKIGADIIRGLTMLDGSYRRFAEEIALTHHERYDGRGYPNGLKGDRIPISGQIVSLVDVYDALITPTVYKAAYTPKQAYNMIMSGECGEFNPKLLKAFEAVREEFEAVAAKYKTKEALIN